MKNFELPDLIDSARQYASVQHAAIGQLYDGQPYTVHLAAVVDWVNAFKEELSPGDYALAAAGAWVHDLIEDCRVTYGDVMKAVHSAEVAEIAFVLATPKGRNRAERHCDAYYREIARNKVATFVKICDRLANAAHSLAQGADSRMLALYREEHAHFSKFLRPAFPEFEPLWNRLAMILDKALATP